jgi:small subunit ribosomal protein S1
MPQNLEETADSPPALETGEAAPGEAPSAAAEPAAEVESNAGQPADTAVETGLAVAEATASAPAPEPAPAAVPAAAEPAAEAEVPPPAEAEAGATAEGEIPPATREAGPPTDPLTTGEPAPSAAEPPPLGEAPPPAEEPPPIEEPPEVVALRAAKEAKTTIEGKVIGWNRGGFHVALDGGVTAFCPNSEMELGRPREPAVYIDRSFTFQVLKVQKRGRRIVLSRAGVLAEVRATRIVELRARQAAGEAVPGRVSSLTDFGAFVDVGGVEGLVHVSEISRRRVNHPGEALAVGQEVAVKVLKIDQAGERVSLSIKALEPDPWKNVTERFPPGAQFTGKIARKTDFGLFVELEADVDGLVHVSRLPPGVAIDDPSLAVGESIAGWVREVDTKRRRIALSLREVPDHDPWEGAAKRYADGTVIQGTVESTAPFGVFITLEPGLTGLLPTSEMQVPRGANPNRVFAPGQKVGVQVVGVDPRRKRISLAREGSKVEGSRSDYQSYLKQQKAQASGMGALAAALSKLKEDKEESAG